MRARIIFYLTGCCLLAGTSATGCGGEGDPEGSSTGDDPNTTCPTVEADAQSPSEGVRQITAAGDHTCAVLVGGGVRCWGEANYGVLGYGNAENIGDDETPFSVGNVDVGGQSVAVATGALNTCALLDDGTVRCWGAVHTGILDAEATDIVGDDETPASRPPLNFGLPVVQIAVGSRHACAVLQDRSAVCWGSNDGGELGIASSRESISATESQAVELGGPVRSVSAGDGATCALLEDESVICWGNGGIAGLGYGNADVIGDNETPVSVGAVSLGASAHAVAVGRFDQCAILECGALRCWGLNRFGSAGIPLDGAIGDNELPDSVAAVEVGGPVKRVAVGTEIADQRSCAVLFDNTVRCWGSQWSNPSDLRPVATSPIDLDGTVVDVTVGDTHACALLSNGTVRCWGSGTDGQLGHGDPTSWGAGQTVEALVVEP